MKPAAIWSQPEGRQKITTIFFMEADVVAALRQDDFPAAKGLAQDSQEARALVTVVEAYRSGDPSPIVELCLAGQVDLAYDMYAAACLTGLVHPSFTATFLDEVGPLVANRLAVDRMQRYLQAGCCGNVQVAGPGDQEWWHAYKQRLGTVLHVQSPHGMVEPVNVEFVDVEGAPAVGYHFVTPSMLETETIAAIEAGLDRVFECEGPIDDGFLAAAHSWVA
jgi:hypothetical protein